MPLPLAAGELKFVLHGERLQRPLRPRAHEPRRTRRRRTGCSSTSGDADADAVWDIDATSRPRCSAVAPTTRWRAVAGPRSWDSRDQRPGGRRPVGGRSTAPLPAFVPPMLATAVDRPFSDRDWLFELKLDGYRVEAVVHGDDGPPVDAQRQDAARYFPELAATLAGGWIDARERRRRWRGGRARPGRHGRASACSRTGPACGPGRQAWRADAPAGDPEDADGDADRPRARSSTTRSTCCTSTAGPAGRAPRGAQAAAPTRPPGAPHGPLREPRARPTGRTSMRAVGEQGLEGIVAKLRRSAYEPGQALASVAEGQDPAGAGAGRGRLRARQGHPPGPGRAARGHAGREGWRYAGEVGSGIDARTRTLMRQLLDEHRGGRAARGPTRLRRRRPTGPSRAIVIRAEFTEWTSDGLLRQAAFKGREVGRDPERQARAARASVRGHEGGERLAKAATRTQGGVRRWPRQRTLVDQPGRTSPARRRPPRTRRGRRVRRLPRRAAEPVAFELVLEDGVRRTPAEAVTRGRAGALAALGTGGAWEVGGHAVKLTNLDKVLFPARATPSGTWSLLRDDRAGDPAVPARPAPQHRPLAGRRRPAGRTSGRSRSRRTRRTGSPAGTTRRQARTSRTRTSWPTGWRPWPGSPTRPSSTCTPGPAASRTTGGRPTRSSTSTPASGRRGRRC